MFLTYLFGGVPCDVSIVCRGTKKVKQKRGNSALQGVQRFMGVCLTSAHLFCGAGAGLVWGPQDFNAAFCR